MYNALYNNTLYLQHIVCSYSGCQARDLRYTPRTQCNQSHCVEREGEGGAVGGGEERSETEGENRGGQCHNHWCTATFFNVLISGKMLHIMCVHTN